MLTTAVLSLYPPPPLPPPLYLLLLTMLWYQIPSVLVCSHASLLGLVQHGIAAAQSRVSVLLVRPSFITVSDLIHPVTLLAWY